MIPKIIHQIWFGTAAIPGKFRDYMTTWQKHHAAWEFRLWNESNLFPLVNQKEFDTATALAQKADIARYEILARHGGVYVDCDFECLKNIEPLCNEPGFAGEEFDGTICNAIIGVLPNHPLMAKLIAEVPASIASGGNPCNTTGPKLLSRFAYNRPDFRIVDRRYLYPHHYEGTWWGPIEEAYAIHHWAHSWAESQ